MAIIDKLDYLNETKRQIRVGLNNLGAGINENDTFRSYVTKIDELYAEYPTQEQVMAFQNAQLQSIQLQNVQPQVIEQPLEINEQLLNIDRQPLEELQPQIIEEQPNLQDGEVE